MGFKQEGAPYEKDDMNIAVYRKDIGDGSAAKSNHTGIVLQQGLNPREEQAAIAHEKVHQYQQRNGDLDYDENNFYWKGKTYPRENLNEHNEKLPWEVEAYKESDKLLKGKQNTTQMKDKFELRNGGGNGASFKDLTSKGLMGASLDTDPLKIKAKSNATWSDWTSNDSGGESRTATGTASETTTLPGRVLKERGTITAKFKGGDDKYITGLVDRGDYKGVSGSEMVKRGIISGKFKDQWNDRSGYKPKTSTRTETFSDVQTRKIKTPSTTIIPPIILKKPEGGSTITTTKRKKTPIKNLVKKIKNREKKVKYKPITFQKYDGSCKNPGS